MVVPRIVFNDTKTVSALDIPLHCCILPEFNGPYLILFNTVTIMVRVSKLKVRINGSELCRFLPQFSGSMYVFF